MNCIEANPAESVLVGIPVIGPILITLNAEGGAKDPELDPKRKPGRLSCARISSLQIVEDAW